MCTTCRLVALPVDDPPAVPVVIVWWAVPVVPELSCYNIITSFSCNTSITSCTSHPCDTNYAICTNGAYSKLKSQEKTVPPVVSVASTIPDSHTAPVSLIHQLKVITVEFTPVSTVPHMTRCGVRLMWEISSLNLALPAPPPLPLILAIPLNPEW